MALFKISKGLKANLPTTKTPGYCWFTIDDHLFYIDYEDSNGVIQRAALNAKDAETLTGASLAMILNSSNLEIPTSKAVLDAIKVETDRASNAEASINTNISDLSNDLEELVTVVANKASASDLTSHIGNKSNPHEVTLSQLGVTATSTELNYVKGVTSNIQTQLNGKSTATNLLNGSTNSSLRSVGSAQENSDYKIGSYAFAEGRNTKAIGNYGSHAEGDNTTASGQTSHAEGYYTKAIGESQHVQGKCNLESDNLAHIVGNGTINIPSNAHTLDWDGNAWFAGDIYVGSTSGINKDEGSKKLATEEYVSTEMNQKSQVQFIIWEEED